VPTARSQFASVVPCLPGPPGSGLTGSAFVPHQSSDCFAEDRQVLPSRVPGDAVIDSEVPVREDVPERDDLASFGDPIRQGGIELGELRKGFSRDLQLTFDA
jgi:hypothetical protein